MFYTRFEIDGSKSQLTRGPQLLPAESPLLRALQHDCANVMQWFFIPVPLLLMVILILLIFQPHT
jgi:hypothetical protein